MRIRSGLIVVGFVLGLVPNCVLAEAILKWQLTEVINAAEARQAVAVDGNSVYVIDNKVIGQYDRKTGKRTGRSTGDAHHLNSGFVYEGKLYCAHSNYPAEPEQSEIKVLDLSSMKLSDFKVFSDPPGSLTVAVQKSGAWWCIFAHYKEENAKTLLVKYDSNWNEQARWTFPPVVISDLGKSSISGAIWDGETLLATGHDKKVIYRLTVPDEGTVLNYIDTVPTPFPGQGIAADPQTGGLVGINRGKKQVIFAIPVKK